MYKRIDEIDIEAKTVFMRMDYNVALADGNITDATRILASLPTLKYALEKQAKLILASHLGRPKGQVNSDYSLLPVAEFLSEKLNKEIIFPEDCVGDSVKKLVAEMGKGDVILLENLRFHAEEENNDPSFAAKLASLADIYISDSFGTVHRAHASTAGMVNHFETKGIGFLMQKEVEFIGSLTLNPERPFLALLGGAKIADKIAVIENLLNHIDVLLVGGGMAYTFLKAQGVDIGKSLVDDKMLNLASKILNRAKTRNIEIVLPVDSVVADKIAADAHYQTLSNDDDWQDNMALDIGPQTITLFKEKIKSAQTIFWNGPMGVFETPPFDKGTIAMAQAIAQNPHTTVVGGGDSLAAVHHAGVDNNLFSHLSTGGGASMELLEGKQLPGLKALEVTP